MRCTLTKKNSTKAERVFYEVLKELKIPFKHRVLIGGREIDFLLPNKICVEIDGHTQDWKKNEMLIKLGYTPIHLTNKELINNDNLKEYVNKLI
jgi:very-short-patch-repair endonuclease